MDIILVAIRDGHHLTRRSDCYEGKNRELTLVEINRHCSTANHSAAGLERKTLAMGCYWRDSYSPLPSMQRVYGRVREEHRGVGLQPPRKRQ